jgi:uncharacterized protein YndB with AHSA1/START domain
MHTLFLALVSAGLLAAPALAKVETSAPDGFVSASSALVPLPPAAVWTALTNWSAWWDPAHSYSGKPGMLRLDVKPGGLLSEQWPGGQVWHAQVVNALPPSLLRLHGGFGPLQSLPVNAVLDFSLKAEGSGTRLTMTYRVAGSAVSKLDTLAAPVDAVMSAGFARLVNFATTGKP